MNTEIILSVCIPTYNGGKRLVKNIKKYLGYDSADIEIVIGDNLSDDGSIEELKKIQDNRLVIYQNDTNVGALKNAVRTLYHGTGKYLMLLLDRDILQIEYLHEYIELLKKETYGVLLNTGHLKSGYNKLLSYAEGIYYLTQSPHPSYYVYLNEAVKELHDVSQVEEDGYYPALIGLLIQRKYRVFLYKELPIILEAEREFILMNASRSWGYCNRKVNLRGRYEVPAVIDRFEYYVHFMKTNGILTKDEDIVSYYKSIIQAACPGYYYCVVDTMTKHRYDVVDYGYSIEDYKRIPFEFYKSAKKILKKEKLASLLVLVEMKWVTYKNYKEFCELVYR